MGAFQNVALKKGINLRNYTHTTMTREEFHQLADKRYNELEALNKINNFYDYEKEFEQIWKDLGRAVLETNLSKLPADRRKKKHSANSGL